MSGLAMRRLWITVAVLGTVIVIAFIGGVLLVNTETGSRWLVDRMIGRLPAGWAMESFSGTVMGPFEVLGLEFTAGPYQARIERAQVFWHPWKILGAQVYVDSVHVTGALLRWDDSAATAGESRPPEGATDGPDWHIFWEALEASGVSVEGPHGIRLHDLELSSAGSPDSFTMQLRSSVAHDSISGVTLQLAGRGDMTHLDVDELTLERDSTRLVASGRFVWNPATSWKLDAQVSALDPSEWSARARQLQGNVRIVVRSEGLFDSATATYSLEVDTIAGVLAGEPVSGQASIRIRGGEIFFDSAWIESRGLSARARGMVADTVNLSWNAESTDLSVWLDRFGGEVEVEGEAHGPRDSLEVHASFVAVSPRFDAYSAARVEGVVDLVAGGYMPSRLSLHADSANVSGRILDSVRLEAEGTRSSHTIHAQVTGPEGRAEASLQGGYDSLWMGHLQSLALDLTWGAWLLEAPAALAVGPDTLAVSELRLGSERGSVRATVAGRIPATWQMDARVDSLATDWLCTLFTDQMVFDSRLDAQVHLKIGSDGHDTVDAQLTARAGRLWLSALPQDTMVTDELDVTLSWAPDQGSLHTKGGVTLRGEYTPFRVDMELPGTSAGMAQLRADSIDWKSMEWSGAIDAKPLALGWLDPLLPDGSHLDGQASLHVAARQSNGMLVGECNVELPPGRMQVWTGTDTLLLEWSASQFLVRADSTGCVARAQSALTTGGQSVGTLEFDLSSESPVVLGNELLDLPLQGKVNAQIDLAPLGPFVAGTSGLKGSFQVGATLLGTPRELAVEGQLELTAEAFLQDLGLYLTQVQLTMNAAGGEASVQGSATSGGGTLQLTGTISRLPSRETPSRLRVEGNNFLAFDTRQARVWISPNLELAMFGDSLNLSGRVDVPKANIEIAELPEQAVAASPDVVIVGDTLTPSGLRSPFWSSVTLGLGHDVFFKGFDVTAFLRGSIDIRQAPGAEAQARGEVVLHEGRYRGMGQDLQIDPGRLLFSGPLADPTIDALAYRRAADHTKAGFKVSGLLSAPQVDMFSDPMKPDNDIMAYILFGRSANAGSESEQMKASEAAAYLGGNLLAGQAATRIGLDEARIDPGYSGTDASLVAGKYISPQLFVGYGQGLFETLHTLRIRYILSTHISLQAETGTRETADVIYQIERGK